MWDLEQKEGWMPKKWRIKKVKIKKILYSKLDEKKSKTANTTQIQFCIFAVFRKKQNNTGTACYLKGAA